MDAIARFALQLERLHRDLEVLLSRPTIELIVVSIPYALRGAALLRAYRWICKRLIFGVRQLEYEVERRRWY
jgi:hypothetical protein